MKLEKFTKNNKKKRNTLLTLGMLLLILGGGIVLYRSYALYQEEKSFNVLKGRVGDFSSGGDIELAWTLNGENTSGDFPTKDSGYKGSVMCYNGVQATWDNEAWALVVEDTSGSSTIKCDVDFTKTYLCKRATTLHTATCGSGAGCVDAGKSSGSTIKFGSLPTNTNIYTGDAFDCDVNGDGTYDADTERFYYVDGYYNTSTKTMDYNYAVLIYYNNWPQSSSYAAYNDSEDYSYYYAPFTVRDSLPNHYNWGNENLSLYQTTRNILNSDGDVQYTSFSYGSKTRLLTYQELEYNCIDGITGAFEQDGVAYCNFLFENTMYVNYSYNSGYWLENSSDTDALLLDGYNRLLEFTTRETYAGVRPVIEVAKSDIEPLR